MTNNLFGNLFFRFLSSVLIIGVLHFVLLKNVLPEIYTLAQPWKIYAFLVPVEVLGLFWIYFKYIKDNTSASKNFMIFLILKLTGSLIFLMPYLFEKNEYTRPFVFQFFAVFFPLLVAEILFLVKMLNSEPEKIEKN